MGGVWGASVFLKSYSSDPDLCSQDYFNDKNFDFYLIKVLMNQKLIQQIQVSLSLFTCEIQDK